MTPSGAKTTQFDGTVVPHRAAGGTVDETGFNESDALLIQMSDLFVSVRHPRVELDDNVTQSTFDRSCDCC